MKNDYPELRAHLRSLGDKRRQEAFAKRCGSSLNYLRKAMSKGSLFDVLLVQRIVVASDFHVPPEELRPDVDWSVFVFERLMRAALQQAEAVAS